MFIPSEVVSQCNSRLYELPEGKGMAQAILGVDVARFGNDETVIYRNFKGHLKLVRKRHGQNLRATVGDIVKEYKRILKEFPDYHGKIYANIDDTGLGGGVTDRLREVKREQKLKWLYIIPINAAECIETDTKAGKDAAEHYNNDFVNIS